MSLNNRCVNRKEYNLRTTYYKLDAFSDMDWNTEGYVNKVERKERERRRQVDRSVARSLKHLNREMGEE